MIKLDDGEIKYLKSFSNAKYVADTCFSMRSSNFCEGTSCIYECPVNTTHTLNIFIQSIIDEATE